MLHSSLNHVSLTVSELERLHPEHGTYDKRFWPSEQG